MTSLEKRTKVKECIQDFCEYNGCVDCTFFDPKDDTDGRYFCCIRDKEKRIPATWNWDMNSAMISD